MSEQSCTFCNIIKENDPSIILYQDEDVVVLKDIKPAAPVHHLVITRQHIRNAKSLTKHQKPLVEHMMEVGKKQVEENSDRPSDSSYGFHWPPFTSISHLHLHAISPASQESFLNRQIFRPDSWWFVKPEYVLSMLDKMD